MKTAPSSAMLYPEHVTKRRLKALFEESSLKAQLDNDGDLMVLTDVNAYWVFIDPEKLLITIMVMAPVVDSVRAINSVVRLLEDVNLFNRKAAVCTAAIRMQDGVILIRFTSDQNYGGGLIFGNLLARLAAFERIVHSQHNLYKYFPEAQ